MDNNDVEEQNEVEGSTDDSPSTEGIYCLKRNKLNFLSLTSSMPGIVISCCGQHIQPIFHLLLCFFYAKERRISILPKIEVFLHWSCMKSLEMMGLGHLLL
jgi:hypothetical protein